VVLHRQEQLRHVQMSEQMCLRGLNAELLVEGVQQRGYFSNEKKNEKKIDE